MAKKLSQMSAAERVSWWENERKKKDVGLDTFESDLKAVYDNYSVIDGWRDAETMADQVSSAKSMLDRANAYKKYYAGKDAEYDSTDIDAVIESLTGINDWLTNQSSAFGAYSDADSYNAQAKKYADDYALFGNMSSDEISEYIDRWNADNEARNAGIDKEIDRLKGFIGEYRTFLGDGTHTSDAFREELGFGSQDYFPDGEVGDRKGFNDKIAEVEEELERRIAELESGKMTENSAALYYYYKKLYEELGAEGYTSDKKGNFDNRGRDGKQISSFDYALMAGEKAVDNMESAQRLATGAYTDYGATGYKEITDEEKSLYLYLRDNVGEEAARGYFNYLYNSNGDYNMALAARVGKSRSESKSDFEKIIGSVGTGVESWALGMARGVNSLFSDKPIPTQPFEYESSFTRESFDDSFWKGALYDVGVSVGNMAPSILATALTANLLGAAGVTSKAAFNVANIATSAATFGTSIYGNAYNEALLAGHGKEQAALYGIFTASAEVALQHVLGGIPGIGQHLTGDFIAQLANRTSNVLLKVTARLAGDAVGEFTEEYLQEILGQVFKNTILGENGEIKLVSEEALYAGFLGALTSAGMNIPTTAFEYGHYSGVGRYYNVGEANGNLSGATALIEEGLAADEESDAHQFADILSKRQNKDKKITNAQLGYLAQKLIDASRKGMSSARRDPADIKASDVMGKTFTFDNSNKSDVRVSKSLVDFANKILTQKDKRNLGRYKLELGNISKTHANTIKAETGIDVTGYRVSIDGTAIQHITNRHGNTGAADRSMADINEIGKLLWVVNNADGGQLIIKDDGTTEKEYVHKNSDNSPSVKILLYKQTDTGFFRVTECVPDHKNKQLWIKSAYKKSSINQVLQVRPQGGHPQVTSKTLLDNNATNNSILYSDEFVKQYYEKNFSSENFIPELWETAGGTRTAQDTAESAETSKRTAKAENAAESEIEGAEEAETTAEQDEFADDKKKLTRAVKALGMGTQIAEAYNNENDGKGRTEKQNVGVYVNDYKVVRAVAASGHSSDAIRSMDIGGSLTSAQFDAAVAEGHASVIKDGKLVAAEKNISDGAQRRQGKVYFNGMQGAKRGKNSLYLPTSGINEKWRRNYSLSEDQKAALEFIEGVLAPMGVDVVLYSSAKNKALPNGMYDGNRIYIDIEAGMTERARQTYVMYAIAHELTHMAERLSPETWRKYADAVLDILAQEDGKSVAELIRERQNEHEQAELERLRRVYYNAISKRTAELKAAGKSDSEIEREINEYLNPKISQLDEAGAIKEIVADASQLILTRNSNFAEKLKAKDEGLFEKIIALAKKAIEKIREVLSGLATPNDGVSAAVEKHLDELTEYFDEMLADTLYKAGYTNETELSEVGEKVQFSYGGSKAKNADKMKLENAQRMLDGGVDSEIVRKKTGWFKGYDGKWRFEIDDSDAYLVENPKFENRNDGEGGYFKVAKLGDVFTHDALYKAYPELKDYTVVIQDTETGTEGMTFLERKQIVLSKTLFERITKEYNDYIWGGKQKEIAEIEATPEYLEMDRYYDDDVIEEMDGEQWLKETELARDKFFSSDLGKRYYQLKWGDVDIRKFEPGWNDRAKMVLIHEIQHAIQHIEGFARGASPDYWARKIQSGYDSKGKTPGELYGVTAGEVEAQDAGNRVDMTGEQRKNTRPDIDRSDVVFAESVDESLSIAITENGKPVVVVNDDINRYASNDKDLVKLVKQAIGKIPYVAMGRQKIKFLYDTKKEVTFSRYTQWLRKNAPDVYKDKMRLFGHPSEIILATTNYINEGLTHPRTDDIIDFARGEILVDILGNQYSAEVVIGFTKAGVCELHDVVKMTPTSFKYKARDALSAISHSGEHSQKRSSLNNSISQKSEKSTSAEKKVSENISSQTQKHRTVGEINRAVQNMDRRVGAENDEESQKRKVFEDNVDKILQHHFPRGNLVRVTKTPDFYADIGLKLGLPMSTTARHIYDACQEKDRKYHQHGLTPAQIKKIPDELANPVMVFDDIDENNKIVPNTIIIVTSLLDPDKSPVIVPILLNDKIRYGNIEINTNAIKSCYGRDNFQKYLEKFINNDAILYINKEKAEQLATGSSAAWLEELKSYSFNTIIHKSRAIVNTFSETSKNSQTQNRRPIGEDDRAILARIAEGAVKTQQDFEILEEYRKNLDGYRETQRELKAYDAEIDRIIKGDRIEESRDELGEFFVRRDKLMKALDREDRKLLNIEAMSPIRRLIAQEREKTQKANQKLAHISESYNSSLEKRQQEKRDKQLERERKRQERNMRATYLARAERALSRIYRRLANPTKNDHIPSELMPFVKSLFDTIDVSHHFAEIEKLEEKLAVQKARINELMAEGADAATIAAQEQYAADLMERIKKLEGTAHNMTWRERMETLTKMVSKVEEVQNSSGIYADFAPGLAEKIQRSLDVFTDQPNVTRLFDAEPELLRTYAEALESISHSIIEAGKLYANKRASSIAVLGDHAIDEFSYAKKEEAKSKLFEKPRALYGIDSLNPAHFGHKLGTATESVISELYDGFYATIANVRIIDEFSDKLKEKYKIADFTGKNEKLHDIMLEGGGHVRLTTSQLMTVYALHDRPQAQKHLYGKGIKVFRGDINEAIKKTTSLKDRAIDEGKRLFGKGKSDLNEELEKLLGGLGVHEVSPKDIDAMIGELTADQIKCVKEMKKFLKDVIAPMGNKTSQTLYLYDMFTEDNYFPIESDKTFIRLNEKDSKDGDISARLVFSILIKGFTKPVQENAGNPIIIRDIFDVFMEHCFDMANYGGLGVAVSDTIKWLNYKNENGSLRGEMELAYGKTAEKYIRNLLMSIEGELKGTDGAKLINKMIRNAKIAAVAANLRVVLLQPTAYIRAGMVLRGKNLAAALRHKPMIREAQEHSELMYYKMLGFYDMNTSSSLLEKLKDDQSTADKVREKSTALAGKMDEITWGCIWRACRYEVDDEIREKSLDIRKDSEEYFAKVRDKFHEVINFTQVIDTPMHKNKLMSDPDTGMKQLTAFMAEPMLTYDMMMSAVEDCMKKKPGAAKQLRRAFIVYSLSIAFQAALGGFADAARDDDDEERWGEKYGEAILKNMTGFDLDSPKFGEVLAGDWNVLNNMPIIKEVFSLLEGYEPTRMDLQGMEKVVQALNKFQKLFTDTGDFSYKDFYSICQAVSLVLGIPISNIVRTVKSAHNTFVSWFGLNKK